MSKNIKSGFTLIEVLIVIIIIGILSSLGLSGMNDLIQTNKAKETARTLTSFAERAVAESKVRKDPVKISVNGNAIEARLASTDNGPPLFSQTLGNGFSANNGGNSTPPNYAKFQNNSVTSKVRIGLSGISDVGCFVACNPAGTYCGSAVKTADKNTFTAYIKKKSGWEAL